MAVEVIQDTGNTSRSKEILSVNNREEKENPPALLMTEVFSMTFNRSNNIELENSFENFNGIYNFPQEELNSESKRAVFLASVRESLKQNDGKLYYDTLTLVDILSQAFSDKMSSNRKLAMDLLCEAIPMYGPDLDAHIGLLFPQLLQNLLHNQSTVKKSALQVLHLYYKYSSNKGVGLDYLIHHGIRSEKKALRNEVFVSIPAFIKAGFTPSYLEKLFIIILESLERFESDESTLPAVLCFEHIKDTMGENNFNKFIGQLEENILIKYDNAIKNSSFIQNNKTNTDVSNRMHKSEELLFGYLPTYIIKNLHLEMSWQVRSDAINEFFALTSTLQECSLLKFHCRDVFEYIHNLVDDANFNVALVSMNIVHQIVLIIGDESKIHLDLIMKILLKKLSDSKIIIRKINLRIALSLMHTLSPSVFLQAILPLLKHKNARVREEVINMITASLLSFPSSEFDLVTLPQFLGFTLVDSRKRVRHASLECFAILAQQLGPGRLSPLVSAIDVLERKNKNADGLLLAVQTRLGRRMLPKISDNELVQYALRLPSNNNNKNLSPDIAWIIAGSTSANDTSRSGSDQESYDVTEKRLFSAGRTKLPWQIQELDNKTERKKIGSAPVRSSNLLQSRKQSTEADITPVCDTWVSENPKVTQNGFNSSKGNLSNDDCSQSSYFEIYKNKMKKLKEAGLKADANIINSFKKENTSYGSYSKPGIVPFEVSRYSPHDDSFNKSNVKDLELSSSIDLSFCQVQDSEKTSPVPMKPTLARSASKKRLEMLETRRNSSGFEKEIDDNLAHTLPKMKGGLLKRLSIHNEYNSPFPSRPTMHRTPSGNPKSRTPTKTYPEEGSNLMRLKSLSNSSPAVFQKNNEINISPIPVSPFGSSSPIMKENNKHIEYIHSPRNEQLYSDSGTASQISPTDNHPSSPKLAKSAQEKLRKFKEEQQRNHSDMFILPNNEEDLKSPKTYYNDSLNYPIDVNGHNFKITPKEPLSYSLEQKDNLIGKHQERKLKNNSGLAQSNYNPSKPLNVESSPRDNRYTNDPFIKLSKSADSTIDHNNVNENDSALKMKQRLSIKGDGLFDSLEDFQEETSREIKRNNSLKGNQTDGNNNNSKEKNGLVIEGRKPEKTFRNIHPKAANSPKVKRKQISRTSPQSPHNDVNEQPLIQQKSYTNNADVDKEVNNPTESIGLALEMLGSNSEEWEMKCDGLLLMRRLIRHHADYMNDIHAVVVAVLNQVKNLRSQVTRSALSCIADIFVFAPKMIELEIEIILKTVLSKACDTNQFIRADTELAIANLVENVNPSRAIAAIIATGVEHRNGSIRKVGAKALADLSEKIGSSKFCQNKTNISIAGKLAVDSQPETRYHGRRILFLLLDHPDLDNLLEKQLHSTNLKPVRDVVENLRNKGLEPANGSATLRRSMRNNPSPATTRRSRKNDRRVNPEKDTNRQNGALDTQNSQKENEDRRSKDNVGNLDCLEKLDSSSWTDRYEGLDLFYELVSSNPSLVTSNLRKIFDRFCPRLCDSNGKVNLYALQTLNRCIPILKSTLSTVSTQLVESLKTAISSKSDAIYTAGKQCLITLIKHIDKIALLQPFINSIQHGNVRNKPEFVDRLTDLVHPLHNKKPSIIMRHVLPLLWNLLSTSASGISTPGRPNLQEVVTRLCIVIHECLGDELIREATSKGARTCQRLEVILQIDIRGL